MNYEILYYEIIVKDLKLSFQKSWRRLQNKELHPLYAFTKYYQGDQIMENEMECACSTHGRDENRTQNFHRKMRRDETTRKI
jgi:hypothetical protein